MVFLLDYFHRDLQFRFDARTSRGKIEQHRAHYFRLSDPHNPGVAGWGEAAPLAGLSPDYGPGFEAKIREVLSSFSGRNPTVFTEAWEWFLQLELKDWPALKFGLETALLDFKNGGRQVLFDSEFTHGKAGISINGLIWMGDAAFMQKQISEKLEQGYNCLKLKIGGLDFETELQILATIREIAPATALTIRLDANGAFSAENALEKLDQLARFEVHSIEQPIKPGQESAMREICRLSRIPIALDEELIGITEPERRSELISVIEPAYLILKPTLLGGLAETSKWIALAEKHKVGWWITSALESNIGLNAIAQFTATCANPLPQGLGTGQLYFNNIPSPLTIKGGKLYYRNETGWQLDFPAKSEV